MAIKDVTINDKGFRDAIKSLENLAKGSVKIGIQSDAGTYPDGTNVLDVAIWNEFGTSKIPSRPFVRQCFSDNQMAAAQYLGRVASNVLKNGGSLGNELSKMGQWYQGKMKSTLLNYPWEKNADSTIKAKGSSKPLVDSSQLVNAIRYEVQNE